MMSRLDSEIVERQRRLLNLKDVNRLKKSASCLGIPNWKKLKKEELVDALLHDFVKKQLGFVVAAPDADADGDDTDAEVDARYSDDIEYPEDLEHLLGYKHCQDCPPALSCVAVTTFYDDRFRGLDQRQLLRFGMVAEKAPFDPMHTLNGLIKHFFELLVILIKQQHSFSTDSLAFEELQKILNGSNFSEVANSRGERIRYFDGSLDSLKGYTHMEVMQIFIKFVANVCPVGTINLFLKGQSTEDVTKLAITLYEIVTTCSGLASQGNQFWT